MQIDITGHHIELTDAIRDFVESKVSKLKNHTSSESMHIHITLDNDGPKKKAEAVVRGSEHLFASAKHDDLYTAVEMLVSKLQKQQDRGKEHRDKNRWRGI